MTTATLTPEAMKRIRFELELSCDEMAAVFGMEGAHRARKLREWENGTREPTGPVLLAYVLLDYLLGEDAVPDFIYNAANGES